MPAQGPAQIINFGSRVERSVRRAARDRDRRLRSADPRRPTPDEVQAYARLIDRLTGAHEVEFAPVDWDRLDARFDGAPTIAGIAASARARQDLANYRPSLMDRLLGLEQEKRRQLTDRVVEAARADAERYERAKAFAARREQLQTLAPGVRAFRLGAIAQALKINGGAAPLRDVVEGFRLYAKGKSRLIGQIDLLEYDALPDEACLPSGCVALPARERMRLQLANASAATLRAAVEMLQVAPVDAVEVVARVCPPDGAGAADMVSVVHARITADALRRVQLGRLNSGQVLAAFEAKLNWTPTRGLQPIRIDDPPIERLIAPLAAA